jgi:TorA maturation chaperone TorD
MLHVNERKRFYAFLSSLFSYPDEELVSALDQGDGIRLSGLLPGCPEPPQGNALPEELQVAFTELFINRLGGAPAPPYGSVYIEAEERLMGTSTLSVAEAYRGEGLAVDASPEPPDYLATELEFLYYLVEMEEKALQQGEVEAARKAARKQGDFCRALLHPWVPEFCRRIKQDQGGHPLYRWGAGLLERFCEVERDWLERLA